MNKFALLFGLLTVSAVAQTVNGIPNQAVSGTLIGVQRITATGSGTYTPTPGTKSVIIEILGAGGGGSGVASPGAGNVNLGQGGQGGGWLQVRLTANFSGASYVVGAKGTGGTAGNNNGGAGSDTTFTTTGTPVTYTAKGGVGGQHLGAFPPPFQWNIQSANSTTGGDASRSGASGTVPFTLSTGNGSSGTGGTSVYSGGAFGVGLASSSASAAGLNADGNGGGGSGAIASGTATAVAGGNGSDGFLVIWEFS